jgi:hypothetical protein
MKGTQGASPGLGRLRAKRHGALCYPDAGPACVSALGRLQQVVRVDGEEEDVELEDDALPPI